VNVISFHTLIIKGLEVTSSCTQIFIEAENREDVSA
jgi:hypothetical protein